MLVYFFIVLFFVCIVTVMFLDLELKPVVKGRFSEHTRKCEIHNGAIRVVQALVVLIAFCSLIIAGWLTL